MDFLNNFVLLALELGKRFCKSLNHFKYYRHYQPTVVHCRTKASPTDHYLFRASASRIQVLLITIEYYHILFYIFCHSF